MGRSDLAMWSGRQHLRQPLKEAVLHLRKVVVEHHKAAQHGFAKPSCDTVLLLCLRADASCGRRDGRKLSSLATPEESKLPLSAYSVDAIQLVLALAVWDVRKLFSHCEPGVQTQAFPALCC